MMNYSHANLCCVLKFEPRCGACKGHATEILSTIEGVYDVTIDAEGKTVTITGEVNPNHCIRALLRCGVHAELVWANLTHPKASMMQRRRMSSNYNHHGYGYDYDYDYEYDYDGYRRRSSLPEAGMWHETTGGPYNNSDGYYSYNTNYSYGNAPAPLDYYQYVDDGSTQSFCSIM